MLFGDAYSVGSFLSNSMEQSRRYETLFDFILRLLRTQKPLPRIAEPLDDMEIPPDCRFLFALAPEEIRFLVWYLATYTLLLWKLVKSEFGDDVELMAFLILWAQIFAGKSDQLAETSWKSWGSNKYQVVFLEQEVEVLIKEVSAELRKRWSDLIRDENVRGALAELCRSDLYYDQIMVMVLEQLHRELTTPDASGGSAEHVKPDQTSFDQSTLLSPVNEEVDKELSAQLSKMMEARGKEWGENDALEKWAVHQVRSNPLAMAKISGWRDFQRETGDKQYDSVSSGEE